jgi:hypothetical protein
MLTLLIGWPVEREKPSALTWSALPEKGHLLNSMHPKTGGIGLKRGARNETAEIE